MITEHWLDKHRRAYIVDEEDGSRIYSIDFYAKLNSPPKDCKDALTVGPSTLCTVSAGDSCEAVVHVTQGIVEVISVRLRTRTDSDPAGGRPEEALRICLETLHLILGGNGGEEILQPPKRGEG